MSEIEKSARVEVEIFGEKYILKGDAAPDYMIMLANYVNLQMKRAVARNSRLTLNKAALLVALNIADDYFQMKQDYDNLVKMLEPQAED